MDADAGRLEDEVGSRKRSIGALARTPVGMLVAGVAAGFAAGALLPVSRVEASRLQPVAEDLRSKMRELGRDALERGRAAVKDAAFAGKDAALASLRGEPVAPVRRVETRGDLGAGE